MREIAPVRPWYRACLFGIVAVVVLVAAGCDAGPPDPHRQADQLTQQIRGMPGVVSAESDVANSRTQGIIHFWLGVEVAGDISGDQVAAITSRFLDGLRAADYRGYQTELDVRGGGSLFVVDGGDREITNGDQIARQARSWPDMRHRFAGAAVSFHAAVAHPQAAPTRGGGPTNRVPAPDVGHPNWGVIQLPDDADYTAVSAAIAILAGNFPELTGGDWTISAGKKHPADIKTSRRLPNPRELEVWTALNADQSITHADVMTINGPVTGPVWVSEKTTPSRDLDVATRLAASHLPIVAKIQPVLYTATDQYSGHVGARGEANGPLAITVGGCTAREYRPAPAEVALIGHYENCRR